MDNLDYKPDIVHDEFIRGYTRALVDASFYDADHGKRMVYYHGIIVPLKAATEAFIDERKEEERRLRIRSAEEIREEIRK